MVLREIVYMPSVTLSPMVRGFGATRYRAIPLALQVGPVLLVLLAAVLAVPVSAAPADAPARYVSPATALPDAYGKVSSDLLGLVDDRFLLPNQSRAAVVAGLEQSGHYVRGGQPLRALETAPTDLVEVYVRTEPGTGASAFESEVHRVSGEDTSAGIVAAWVVPDRILEIANTPTVREIRPVLRPLVRTGSVTSAGDILQRTAQLRAETGLSGAGVRVGVISDGVDHWKSALATGDLPASLRVLRNSVGGDEGTAMLEIVHDIAPNASLLFHDCGWDVLEFNRAVDALADAGCRVIIDDIGWGDEPFFEDGVVAAHVANVVRERGVVHVSAAGNDGDVHYQGRFRDDGKGWHDFSDGTASIRNRLYVDLSPGGSLTTVFQWSEPFGAAGSNYDIALYDTADRSVPLAVASRVQDGDDDPVEVLSWVNTGSTRVHAEIDVSKPLPAPARILELFVFLRGDATLLPENTIAADSVYGHSAADGVIAVAAIDATDPAAQRIEPYSSRGPSTILLPSVVARQKPDCSGFDGVQVSGAGSFPSGFWGTSASAPHVGGLAALLWSGRQDVAGARVREILLATADDLGATGPDPVYGTGRPNATAMHALFSSAPGQKMAIPGRIEAEDYDAGGQGIAYHDTSPGNEGGVYRADDVDIEPLPGPGGYNVGWVRPGEWLRYTVNVTETGDYTLRLRGAATWGQPSVSLLVDGAPAATVPIALSGSYDVFAITNATVRLGAGEHELRALLSGYFNLDYLEFERSSRVLRVPGAAGDPADLDADGLYEDVNGNGQGDFADIILYFNQMDWIAANEPIEAFDYNHNGTIDFADVTVLFGLM